MTCIVPLPQWAQISIFQIKFAQIFGGFCVMFGSFGWIDVCLSCVSGPSMLSSFESWNGCALRCGGDFRLVDEGEWRFFAFVDVMHPFILTGSSASPLRFMQHPVDLTEVEYFFCCARQGHFLSFWSGFECEVTAVVSVSARLYRSAKGFMYCLGLHHRSWHVSCCVRACSVGVVSTWMNP